MSLSPGVSCLAPPTGEQTRGSQVRKTTCKITGVPHAGRDESPWPQSEATSHPCHHPLKTHPFIHPSKHLRFTHRFFYPSKSSATHSPTQPPIDPSAPKLILPFLHSPIHLFNPQMHPSTHPALHSFTDPLVSLFFSLPKMSHHRLPLSSGKRRLIQSPQPLTGKGRLLQTWASPGSGPGLR